MSDHFQSCKLFVNITYKHLSFYPETTSKFKAIHRHGRLSIYQRYYAIEK